MSNFLIRGWSYGFVYPIPASAACRSRRDRLFKSNEGQNLLDHKKITARIVGSLQERLFNRTQG